jgi:hypothetical protein
VLERLGACLDGAGANADGPSWITTAAIWLTPVGTAARKADNAGTRFTRAKQT